MAGARSVLSLNAATSTGAGQSMASYDAEKFTIILSSTGSGNPIDVRLFVQSGTIGGGSWFDASSLVRMPINSGQSAIYQVTGPFFAARLNLNSIISGDSISGEIIAI